MLNQRSRNPVLLFLAMFMALALQACGSMQKPVSSEDYVQSARAQVGAAYKTIGDLRASRQITAVDGRSYFDRVEKVEKDVDLAETTMQDGASTATVQGKVQIALTALLAIQGELNARKK